jgi:hypothetical protein
MSDIQARLNSEIDKRNILQALNVNKGFLLLNSIVQEQVDELQRSILFDPCEGVDSAWLQEYKKGQLVGKLSWAQALDAAIASLEISIEHLKEHVNDEPASGSTDANHAP